MSPEEYEEFVAAEKYRNELADDELFDEEVQTYYDDPAEVISGPNYDRYDYSDYDPDALDSDEIFDEIGTPMYDDNWDEFEEEREEEDF